MGLLKEFKEFAVKGNAVDIAVGIMVGAAFGKIVTSIVNDLIMPPIGLLLGGIDFSKLQLVLRKAIVDTDGKVVQPEVVMRYGTFANTLVDFLIVAFCIFLMLKGLNKLRGIAVDKKDQA